MAVERNVFRVTPQPAISHHTLTPLEFCDVGGNRSHIPGELEPGNEGRVGRIRIHTETTEDVCKVQTDGPDAHEDLARPGLRDGNIAKLQDLGSPVSAHNRGSHVIFPTVR